METTTLGRTGLEVSVAGLGCGGSSRLGQSQGKSMAHSIAIVREAIAEGVNFIDTALAYGTEEIVGQAIAGHRDTVILSTKSPVVEQGMSPLGKDYCSERGLIDRLEGSLKRLKTDYVDIFHLHGVTPEQYPHCRDVFVPVLRRLQEQGKIRWLGVTERFISDPGHAMLMQALEDDAFDVVMVGFNMLNQSARSRVLEKTRQRDVGALCMFAVRRALSDPNGLVEALNLMIEKGQVDKDAIAGDPLSFLVEDGFAASLQEAAYRFCRHEPGIDVVLTGTGNLDHLRENLASLQRPALPRTTLERLERLFGRVDCISGN